MRCNKLGLGLLLAIACNVPTDPAASATATTTFQVTANVNVSCTISATDLNFGDYTEVQLDGQSEISLTCTNSAQWNVGLNDGTSPGVGNSRRMTGPNNFHLRYHLFSDPARTVTWGNTVGTDTVSGVGTGAVQILNVYGRVPGSQNVGSGGYVDTITATITF